MRLFESRPKSEALLDRVGIGDYLAPAAAGAGLAGAPSELAAALSVPVAGASGGVCVPWEVIGREGSAEQRASPVAASVRRLRATTTARSCNGRSFSGCSGRNYGFSRGSQ